jgi:hypothetical protein
MATAAPGKASLSLNEQIAMRTLEQAFKADAIIAAIDGQERRVVRTDDWRTWFYREGKPGDEQETKQRTFRRAITSLLAKGRIATRDNFIWRPDALL